MKTRANRNNWRRPIWRLLAAAYLQGGPVLGWAEFTWLTVETEGLPGGHWGLQTGRTLIGSDVTSPNLLLQNDSAVSREHAVTRSEKDISVFEDLGSANGSRINGRPCTVPHKLRDGDELLIGSARLVFHSQWEEVRLFQLVPFSMMFEALWDLMRLLPVGNLRAELAEVSHDLSSTR